MGQMYTENTKPIIPEASALRLVGMKMGSEGDNGAPKIIVEETLVCLETWNAVNNIIGHIQFNLRQMKGVTKRDRKPKRRATEGLATIARTLQHFKSTGKRGVREEFSIMRKCLPPDFKKVNRLAYRLLAGV